MSFSDLPLAHVTQARDLFPITISITVVWFGAMVHMTVLGPRHAPTAEKWLLVVLPLWWIVLACGANSVTLRGDQDSSATRSNRRSV